MNQFGFNNFNPQQNYISQYNRVQQTNGIIWVQGIEGAKAYQLIPNSNVVLMDSENDGIFYIKVSDNVGMCNLRIFNFSEITDKQFKKENDNNIDMSVYVTKKELEDALKNINGGKYNGKSTIQSNESK